MPRTIRDDSDDFVSDKKMVIVRTMVKVMIGFGDVCLVSRMVDHRRAV